MPVLTEQQRAWAASGAMALTGRPDGVPLLAPDGVVDRVRQLGAPLGIDPLPLLAERAAIAGLRRGGAVSCGGGTRLLPVRDGWIAVSLARETDLAAVPAWLELDQDLPEDPWPTVTEAVADRPGSAVVERGILLDLPIAGVPPPPGPTGGADRGHGLGGAAGDPGAAQLGGAGGVAVTWTDGSGGAPAGPGSAGDAPVVGEWLGAGAGGTRGERPLVVDLSSLWAGPLCARLLGERGARVVKVESVGRPDGARSGPAAFFDLLHPGQEMVALDLAQPDGIAHLRRLLHAADVVIEASRPRALEQMGTDVEEVVRHGPTVWVSITGHGRQGPDRNRVAFGDDAAAAGGLVAWDDVGPCFVADAVADPLSGIAAAAAAATALASGGRWLLDVALSRVAAFVAAGTNGEPWRVATPVEAEPPRAPLPPGPAAPLGAHTQAVLAELS